MEKRKIICVDEPIGNCRVYRPQITKPCGSSFDLNVQNIVANDIKGDIRFYQVCSNCGYLTEVPKTLLSLEEQNEIIKRCEQNPALYANAYILSQNIAMERYNDDKSISQNSGKQFK